MRKGGRARVVRIGACVIDAVHVGLHVRWLTAVQVFSHFGALFLRNIFFKVRLSSR